MAKAITLWRTWDESDMANSDSYFATKREAVASLVLGYEVTKLVRHPDDEDLWTGEIPDSVGGGGTVHLERIEVVPTRAGIAHALKHVPHR